MSQLADAIANMDSATQQQLLAALLSHQQSGPSRQDDDRAPTPAQPQPASSQPPSPQAFSLYPDTLQEYEDQKVQQHLAQQSQLAAFLNGSHPPSHASSSSPIASPYFDDNALAQYYQHQLFHNYQHRQQAQQLLHAQQQGSPQLVASSQSFPTPRAASFHNRFSPRLFGQPQTMNSALDVQAFLAMDTIAPVSAADYVPDATDADANSNGGWVGGDVRIRGGSATGRSYAAPADTEDRGDSEFMFSPLVSSPLALHSSLTPNSSLPPSDSCPPGLNGITPGEYFTPLGSPAIMHQSFQPDFSSSPHPWPQPHHTRNSSLQDLIDQARTLTFDISQHPGSPNHHYSPTSQTNMSPRLGPTDAGHSTGAGSGKRGAGGRKARPSPLLKATPDSAVRKKNALGRSSSIGSGGGRIRTTSPFLGPTTLGYGVALFSAVTPPPGSTTTRPSPEHSSGSTNTTSPVDLAMHDFPSAAALEQQELMCPPPVPSASNAGSRRSSLTQNGGGSSWLSPVTPASFMDFSSDIPPAGLFPIPRPNTNGTDPLSSNGGPQRSQSYPTTHEVDDGDSAHSISTAGPSKPRTKKASAPGPSLVGHDSSSSNSVASSSSTAKPPTSTMVPVEQPPTRPGATAASKGKGRAGSVLTPEVAGAAGARKIAKGPGGRGPKIKPLLPDGLSADAVSRLSIKSNYQNIFEGRGTELFGFDSSTVSSLHATQGARTDDRSASHKAAEQKRRDSLKLCFEELRYILPPIAASASEEEKRPGEGNVGGHRGGSVDIDPENPNRGVSKVALLRRSNEYVGMLHERIERRDVVIDSLRVSLRDAQARLGREEGEEVEVEGLDLDCIDKDEKAAGTMAFYDRLDSDDEDTRPRQQRKAPPPARRKSNPAANTQFKGKPGGGGAPGVRRSTRRSNANAGTSSGGGGGDDESESTVMDMKDGG